MKKLLSNLENYGRDYSASDLSVREEGAGYNAGQGDAGTGESGAADAGADTGAEAGAADAGAAGGAGEGDKSTLSDKEAELLKDVMRHKNRAKTAESELNTLRDQMAAIQQALGDAKPEDVAALLQAQKDNERQQLEKKGQYDKIIEQMRTENEKLIQAERDRASALQQQLDKMKSDIEEITIGRAFAESKYVREKLRIPTTKLARREFGDHFEVEGDKVVGYDKPRGAADRVPLVDGQGNTLSFDDAMARLVAAHPESKDLIRTEVKPGANSSTQAKANAKVEKPKAHGASRIEQALKSQ